MTNDPRYSPPPQQPGYRTGPSQPVPPAYAQGHQPPYNQQYDWRYQPSQPAQASQPTTQYRRPYEPFGDTGIGAKVRRAGINNALREPDRRVDLAGDSFVL